jgi:site-specific DNA-methyltransferase (adenine-specific)
MKNRNLNHKDHWQTPTEFFELLNKEFDFNFDPCPYQHNVDIWDGLAIDWEDRSFVNPPYSRKLKEAFVKKAIEQAAQGKLCVCLLPVSTSTKLFHNFILPNNTEIRFLEKRLKFTGTNTKGELVSNKTGMLDSMLVIFDGRKKSSYEIPKLNKPHCWGKMTWILDYKEGQEPDYAICRCEHGAAECIKITRQSDKPIK